MSENEYFPKCILIADDDEYFQEHLADQVRFLLPQTEIKCAENVQQALNILKNSTIDMAFVDLKLIKKFDALEIIKECHTQNIYSVVLSNFNDEEAVEKSYESGCLDYFSKGDEPDMLKEVLQKFQLYKDQDSLKSFIKNQFITQDQEFITQLEFIFKNSSANIPIFLSGPTGVGKTTLANFIHRSSQSNGRFVQLNCAEINANLIESELFGHKKGSFTGATSDSEGKIKAANKGTLFLDEVCSIPLDIQSKLLKVLEEKSFYPVGSDKIQHSEFNIIAASHENIHQKIQEGKFRLDLYHRLSGINLQLKPLKDRKDDIPLMIKKFLSKGRKIVLKDDAVQALKDYSWPGNIRELAKLMNVLKLTGKGIIHSTDLKLINSPEAPKEEELSIRPLPEKDMLIDGLGSYIKKIEKEVVQKTLAKNRNAVIETIKELQISRSKFYKIIGQKEETD